MSRTFRIARHGGWPRLIIALMLTVLALASAAAVFGPTRPAQAGPLAPAATAWTPPSPSYRISVTADGLYALDYTYLSNAGLPVDSIDPRTFRMFYMGEEIAIRVVGEEDGVFGSGDAVLFYGRGVDSLFNDGLLPTNKYTGTNVFWLSYGGPDGRRMAEPDGSSGSGTAPDAYPHRERLGRNYWYFSAYPFENDADHYFDNWIRTYSTTARTYSFTAANVYAGAATGTLTVDLLGYRDGAHHIKLYVNNYLVLDDASSTWGGFDTYTVQADVPQAYFVNGSNAVRVELTYDAPKTADEVYVNWVDVTYYDTYVAENNVLAYRNLDAGSWRYEVSDFSSADIEVYDVTELGDVRRFTGTTISGTGPYSVGYGDSTTGARRYLALTASAWLTSAPALTGFTAATYPASSYSVPDLLNTANGADYIIVTHSNFWVDAGRLAQWRSRDFRVVLVDVQQVYDQFNGGVMSAEAIHDFLAYAYTNWSLQPKYVVLLGDGSSDIRNYRYSASTYIPPYLYLADPDLGETAADNRFVTITGDDLVPEMHLGRLPANNAAQAGAMVNKIIAYEDPRGPCQCNGWNYNTLFIADDLEGGGGNFYDYSDEVAEGFTDPPDNMIRFVPDPPYTVTKAYLGRTCNPSILPDPGPDPATGCQADITTALETGALFVSYVGHATKAEWSTEGLMTEALLGTVDNGPCLPVAFPMTCFEGSYHDPTTTAMAEAAVRMPVNGFIASWSPTGFGLVSGHDYLEKGVVLALLHENVERLGPATTYAKQYLEDNAPAGAYRDLLDTFGLIGDPGLRVKTEYVCSLIPTAVLMADFRAERAEGPPGGVRVSWQTESEADMVGFNVLRSGGEAKFTRLNDELLSAQRAGSESGSGYVYLDTGAADGKTYWYKLEVMKLDGTTQAYGPVQVRDANNVLYLPVILWP
jgi:hypothetical protein